MSFCKLILSFTLTFLNAYFEVFFFFHIDIKMQKTL